MNYAKEAVSILLALGYRRTLYGLARDNVEVVLCDGAFDNLEPSPLFCGESVFLSSSCPLLHFRFELWSEKFSERFFSLHAVTPRSLVQFKGGVREYIENIRQHAEWNKTQKENESERSEKCPSESE